MEDEYELDIPIFVELKESQNVDNELGVFCSIQLNPDRFLGNYKGKIKKSITQCIDTSYVWTIFNSKQAPLYYIDASDPKDSNWLRFIRYTSDAAKSNVICMQQNQQINYFTLKTINPGDELLTYMPSKKRSQLGRPTKHPKSITSYRLVTSDDIVKHQNEDIESLSLASSSTTTNKEEAIIETKRFNFKCDICSYRSNIYDDIKTHIFDNHINGQIEMTENYQIKQIVETMVDVLVQNRDNLLNDYQKISIEKSIESKKSFKCNYCNELFALTSDLIEHLTNNHKEYSNNTKDDFQSTIYTHLLFNSDIENNLIEDDVVGEENDTIEEDEVEQDQEVDGEEEEEEEVETQTTQSENESQNKYTCSHCKKQFDDRVSLAKHQRTELSVKMAKKKKEARKKKWRDAHWKRKIDLSFIETLTLTNLSTNIADNLSFCVDGTGEDLKAYSREVKDYLQTELGQETELHMFLKCFPDLYEKVATKVSPFMDLNLVRKANAYFAQTTYSPIVKENYQKFLQNKENLDDFECENCYLEFKTFVELIKHQTDKHNFKLKTTYDQYNGEENVDDKNSPIGYLRCDPFAYILNLYWDNTLQKTCENCGETMSRGKYEKHLEKCVSKEKENIVEAKVEEKVKEEESKQRTYKSKQAKKEEKLIENEKIITKEAIKTDEEDKESEKLLIDESSQSKIDQETSQIEEKSSDKDQKEDNISNQDGTVTGKRTRKRSSRLIDDLTVTNVLNTKRRVQNIKSSYAAENFVFFDNGGKPRNSSGENEVVETNEKAKKTRVTPVRKAKSNLTSESTPTVTDDVKEEPVSAEDLNHSLVDDTISEVIQNTTFETSQKSPQTPSLLETALKSDENLNAINDDSKLPKKRGRKSKTTAATSLNLIENKEVEEILQIESQIQPKIELRTSSRIRKVSQKKAEAEIDNLLVNQTLNINRSIKERESSEKTSTAILQSKEPLNEDNSKVSITIEEPFQDMEIDESQMSSSQLDTSSLIDSQGKIMCRTCKLEFTSQNSANRHQERSCLRLSILHIDSEDGSTKRQCPCCGILFPNTHSISIHIFKHHKQLLGPANQPPLEEAVLQNEKVKKMSLENVDEANIEQHQQKHEQIKIESIKIKKCPSTGKNDEETYVIQKKRKYTKRNLVPILPKPSTNEELNDNDDENNGLAKKARTSNDEEITHETQGIEESQKKELKLKIYKNKIEKHDSSTLEKSQDSIQELSTTAELLSPEDNSNVTP